MTNKQEKLIKKKEIKTIEETPYVLKKRSVADSNRRTRFCRPLPSHSANRPYF